tara:strand:- start:8008 stop:8520 length:513 start_codon:yes stop_codon:yes gene_type:complete
MIAVFKIFGLVVLWFAFSDAVQLGLSMYWGIDPEYGASIVLTSTIAVSVKSFSAVLLIFSTQSVLSFIKLDPDKAAYGTERAFAIGAASLIGVYFLVIGLASSIAKYTIARVQFSEINSQGMSLFTTNIYDWEWQGFIYGLVQAALGLALLVAVFAYNKKLQPTADAAAE